MTKKKKETDEWKEVGSGNYFPWDVEGKELAGRFLRFDQGSMGGQIAVLDVEGEDKLCSAPSILARLLTGNEGKLVKIVYKGEVKFKSGRTGKDFQVFVKPDE